MPPESLSVSLGTQRPLASAKGPGLPMPVSPWRDGPLMTTRPRQMPTITEIVAHWRRRLESNPNDWPEHRSWWIGFGEPFCFRCGWLAPVIDGRATSWNEARHWLDRAHIIDRCDGGLDAAQNVVPLCQLCHDDMPGFVAGQEQAATAWLRHPPERPHADLWQMWTTARGPQHGRGRGGLARERGRFLEVVVRELAASR